MLEIMHKIHNFIRDHPYTNYISKMTGWMGLENGQFYADKVGGAQKGQKYADIM